MSSVTQQQVEQALQQYVDPHLNVSLASTSAAQSVSVEGDKVSVQICLGYPADSVKESMQDGIAELIAAIPGVKQIDVALDWKVQAGKARQSIEGLKGVKNIIAVASGKGGVGKSTTSVNLALALLQEGAKVGLMDADIYGPSQQMMLGVPEGRKPQQSGQNNFVPIEALGLQTMSMAYLITDKTPLVWRGPMAGGALQQMILQTLWDELDYLIVDMPPGTGDVQLTLSQQIPVTGSVIVTTPQDIALLDAKKGIEMFNKVEIPVLGVVENMATHICSECGHEEHIFGDGGGDRIAKDYRVPMLGSLPLAMGIRQHTDAGRPTVVTEPAGQVADAYRTIARKMTAELAELQSADDAVQLFPNIEITND
jgi:ATP-binding protein involved in chromosome partitioning